MASAGTVTVDFAAETARFRSELQNVNKRLKSIEGSFKSLEQVARNAFAFFSANLLTNFVRGAAEAADALGKTAAQLRLSTSELKTFQVAAQGAGLEVGASNRLLSEASKRLVEAAQGGGEASKYIKGLGLHVAELRGLRPDQLFGAYASAIASLRDPGEQAAAAQALMGQAAADAMPFILSSGEALDEARQFVERYGLAVGSVETKQIAAANDALGQLSMVTQAAAQHFAAGLAPSISAVSAKILDAAGSAKQFQTAGELAGVAIQAGFALVMNAYNALKAVLFGVAGAISSVNATLYEGFAKLADVARDVTTTILDFQLQIARAIPGSFGSALELAVTQAQGPLRSIAENVAAGAEHLASAMRASAEANLQSAREAVAEVKSLGQIQDEIVANMAASRAAAEAHVAADASRASTATGSLQMEGPIGLTQQQNFDIISAAAEAAAQRQKELQREITENLSDELQQRARMADFYIEQERRREEAAQQAIIQARTDALSAGIEALQAYAGQSKSQAKALVLINKARAIASAIQNTYQGATLQLTTGDPYTAVARAAAVVAFGVAQVAAIVRTGYGEIQAINANGGAAMGTPSNPVYTQPQQSTASEGANGAGDSVLAVHIHGNFFGSRETVNYLIEQFRTEINERDVVLFSPESRQAQEITAP